MGAVCSAGMVEKTNQLGGNDLGFSGKLKKGKSFTQRKGESCSDSSPNDHRKKQKKRDSREIQSGFSSELKLSTPTRTGEKKIIQRSSFLGRAGESFVDALDTLGSNVSNLNTNNGFASGMTSRGNKISILAFEVANTITKGSVLFKSLSEENIQFLKKEILESEGVQLLVSTDMKELLALAEFDKREELNIFSREVARFGDMCKEPQWHNLSRYISRLDSDVLGHKQPTAEAEKTMQELINLAQITAELYHELNAYDRFEQDYQQKVKEMESLNLPLKGESLTIFQSELKHQRKLVRSLKKKSLWSRNLEEIVEKLVDIIVYIYQAISEFLGDHGTSGAAVKYSKGPQRLGEAGLALHYANIINQINIIVSRPTSLPPNLRDTLYHGLPNNIKAALPSRLQTIDAKKELSITQAKAEMDKILDWLLPFATNTTKAHQGFGWVGEWANTSNEFGETTVKESNLIRLQTLHYADKQKIDGYILELVTWLHHVVSFVRYKHHPLKPMPNRSPNGPDFQSKMRLGLSVDSSSKPSGKQLSQEDRSLLEEVMGRRGILGVSKSEDFALAKREEARVWNLSRSAGNSPGTQSGRRWRFDHHSSNVLDIMDGLSYQ